MKPIVWVQFWLAERRSEGLCCGRSGAAFGLDQATGIRISTARRDGNFGVDDESSRSVP
jgi:hypothetical protein